MSENETTAESASRLRRQMMLLVRRLRRESADLALPISLMLLLGRIEQLGEQATPTAVAWQEGLRPQNLSAMLRKLEQLALVYKQEDPLDRRKSHLKLTDEGRRVLLANRADRDSWLAQAMAASLSREEVLLLRRAGDLLERLAAIPVQTDR